MMRVTHFLFEYRGHAMFDLLKQLFVESSYHQTIDEAENVWNKSYYTQKCAFYSLANFDDKTLQLFFAKTTFRVSNE